VNAPDIQVQRTNHHGKWALLLVDLIWTNYLALAEHYVLLEATASLFKTPKKTKAYTHKACVTE
jgi:hypothetical protein